MPALFLTKYAPVCITAAVCAALMACGGGESATDPTTPPQPTRRAVPTPSPQTSEKAAPEPAPTATATPRPTPTPGPGSLPSLNVEPAFPNVELGRMVHLTYPPGGGDRLYLVLQPGLIVSFENRQDVEALAVFLNITERVSDQGNEEGLLGLAFDPNYESNGYFYVYYSAANPRRSVISRFSVESGKGDGFSEKQVMVIPQPYSNHNGGHIVFGPDGHLYIGVGDGGSANDPQGNGQDKTTLLGTILRIDVSTIDSEGRYTVPPDNPFVGEGGGVREEIWAYGLRNPWRFNFDRVAGDLWAADVGQNAWEEVDIIRPGLNYGWNIMEGAHCFAGGRSLGSLLRRGPEECDRDGLELPVVEYGRDGGCSITGGYVYRGARLPSLAGAYVYGDFCSGKIWAVRQEDGDVTEHRLLVDSGLRLAAFGEGQEGELYMLSFDEKIYRFAAP